MKKILLIIFVLSVLIANAQDICTNYKPEIKVRDKESMYTKENALRSLKYLESYVKGDGPIRDTDPWWSFGRVQGYILRRNALESGSDPETLEYFYFCEFITRQGVHRE